MVPVVPPTLYAGGLNYPYHVVWAAEHAGAAPVRPEEPIVGTRAVSGLIAHEETIIKPKDATEEFQYEALASMLARYVQV